MPAPTAPPISAPGGPAISPITTPDAPPVTAPFFTFSASLGLFFLNIKRHGHYFPVLALPHIGCLFSRNTHC